MIKERHSCRNTACTGLGFLCSEVGNVVLLPTPDINRCYYNNPIEDEQEFAIAVATLPDYAP